MTLFIQTSLIFILSIFLTACQSNTDADSSLPEPTVNSTANEEAAHSSGPLEKHEIARKEYAENPNDPDALIWYGRRTAYLGRYEEAIDIFSTGIQLHPTDARMYRHRGHRYISTRRYDKAIADLEQAVTLIKHQQDQVEPDGLPNSRNIPIGTLHGNIWYHLGLAYYLKNDLDRALTAFTNRAVTEKYDDNIVSAGHWLYMILSRQGKIAEANAAVKRVDPDMDIIENFSYHTMCLFYKQLIQESDLEIDDPKSSAANVITYGLGNWYMTHKQDTLKAKQLFQDLLENGNEYSFAYLAAASDWERLFKED